MTDVEEFVTKTTRLVSLRADQVLNLQRVYEQNRQLLQKKDTASKRTKGTPRLLLMGRRRSRVAAL